MVAIRPPGYHGCVSTTLAWHIGVDADPGLQEPLRQISTWIDLRDSLISGGPEDQQRLIEFQGAWYRLVRNTKHSKRLTHVGWRCATGPISATILTLRSIGREPSSPVCWRAKNVDLEGDVVVAYLASDGKQGTCSKTWATARPPLCWRAHNVQAPLVVPSWRDLVLSGRGCRTYSRGRAPGAESWTEPGVSGRDRHADPRSGSPRSIVLERFWILGRLSFKGAVPAMTSNS